MYVKKKIVTCSILISGWIIVTIFSCTKNKAKISISCDSPETVSFSKDVIPIFNQSCNIAGCHSGMNPTGNLDLDAAVAFSRLMKTGTGYIDTIHPNSSLLYAQMTSTSKPMPPAGKLDDCKIKVVLKWIQQKAKNN